MTKVAAGGPLLMPPGSSEVLIEAKSWASELFREDFKPSGPVALLPIGAEGGRYDVVRFSYARGPITIEVAQTRHVIAVRLRGLNVDRREPVARQAAKVASLVLKLTPPIEFENIAPLGEGSCATRVQTQEMRRRHSWPSWRGELRFWTDNVDVGFVTLKAGGEMSQQFISPDASENAKWFARYIEVEARKAARK
jgi:hypothetical protein